MRSLSLTALLAVAALSSASVVQSPVKDDTFELLILHNNDMHARFEQTSQFSGACTTTDREAGKCYGGFPRVAHVVKEARRAAASGKGPPVLYLNAGDTYTGTAWFTIYKWQIAAEFINALQPDAVSLGNHEFDEGVDGVIPFIRNITTPVLAANLILDKVPEMAKETNLYKSIIITKNGIKIGIIGYLTPETKFLAPRNNVEYESEITAIEREVKKLKQKGVKIFIALGHSGYIKDLEIASKVADLDLIIGGHSNTFLWNYNTTIEKPEFPQGPYPTNVQQSSGKVVRVVQAYAYTKYMGKLHLVFDSNGEIIECDGTPILLNNEIPKDPEVLQIVNKYHEKVDSINNIVIGSSLVFLDGESCRLRECNIGNLIADSFINCTKENFNNMYPDINIAIVQGGHIRASIDHPEKPFNMTREDWITALPFAETLIIVTMNGSILRQSLEHSVESWRTIDSLGQFLQFSGIEVTYDLERPPGSRVVDAKAICCEDRKLSNIEDEIEYKVIMPGFLADSGDGFSMFNGLHKETLPDSESNCVLGYVTKYSPIDQKENGRITLLNENKVLKPNMVQIMNTDTKYHSSCSIMNIDIKLFYTTLILILWVSVTNEFNNKYV